LPHETKVSEGSSPVGTAERSRWKVSLSIRS
jgi:hypothetical protein